jgi:putative transposase
VLVWQAYRFALDPTPAQERKLASHAGAARFAYNFGLALVKERLDRRQAGEDVQVPWTLSELRREWNRAKDEIAPWWAENSKEAASAGLVYLANGLKAFRDSKYGRRAGARIGFPRFKRRGGCVESFRYTTGRFGISGRCRVRLPRIGHVRTHEPTIKLARDEARIVSASIRRQGDRWFCSFCCLVERHAPAPRRSNSVLGLDVGLRELAVDSNGQRVQNPRPLAHSLRRLRRLQRKLDRQRRANNPGCYDEMGRAKNGSRPLARSSRMQKTQRRVRRLHARAANIRSDAIHQLTSRVVAEHEIIVVERLSVRGLRRSGNRGLRRALHDASLAEIRRQFQYKLAWRGGTLVEAPTFFPSSKRCSSCRAVKAKLPLSERTFRCERCGLVLDRDINAARNLATLTAVAASGAETKNARSPTQIRPATGGHGVDREAGIALAACETGIASEQSEAA